MKPLALAAQPQRLPPTPPPLYVWDADTDVDAGADAEGFAATARKIAGAHVFRV